jgi:hypothetical protein
MGITMVVNDDPDASLVGVAGFAAFTLAFGGVAAALCRPLFARMREPMPYPVTTPGTTG